MNQLRILRIRRRADLIIIVTQKTGLGAGFGNGRSATVEKVVFGLGCEIPQLRADATVIAHHVGVDGVRPCRVSICGALVAHLDDNASVPETLQMQTDCVPATPIPPAYIGRLSAI